MRHGPRLAAALAAATLTLAGCGGSDDPGATASATVPASAPYNDADVAFATGMIPHHAQALSLVDLTRDRRLDPGLERLAERILAAQAPEIETMTGWLREWDQPIPETSRDHVHAHDPGHGGAAGGSALPGMVGDAELRELEAAGDAAFEDRWLELMIAHHEGAVAMARTEQDDGEYPAARDLADAVAASQTREIAQLQALLEE